MEYLAACCRPEEQDTVSVLLQQYQYRQGQIVFACICGDRKEDGRAGGYMTERCLTWFRGLNLKKLLKNREDRMEELSEEFGNMVRMAGQEMEDGGITEGKKLNFAAVLCVEDIYIMLHRGTTGIYILNTAFGRAYLRRLEGRRKGDGLCEGYGLIQPDIGILLATKGFYEQIEETVLKESLFVRDITSEKQMEKHLMELGRESARLGGTGIGAIMIRTAE